MLQKQIEVLEQQVEYLQMQIDNLMFEHCPNEMSKEQIDNWRKHQEPAENLNVGG